MYDAGSIPRKEFNMAICPIAIVAGCEKCPAFKVCPMTKILGDQKEKKPEASAKTDRDASAKKKS